MKKIFVLLLLIFTFSCSSDTDENKIYLFNDISFQLDKKEAVTDLTKEITDLYFSYLDNADIQAPLFKYITGEGYEIFIGLPIATDFNKLKNSIESDDIITGSTDNNSSQYFYHNFNHNEKNITKYLLEIDKNLVYIILISDTDKKLSVSEQQSISKRITKE